MAIKLEKTTKITNVDVWLRVAPPKGGITQWKDGCSAKELAGFVIGTPKDFSKMLEDVVRGTVGYVPGSFTGEPEATTKLPPTGSRGPREHDLLLFDKRIVIGIEAKVDEPFGNNKSILQENNTISENKKARIAWLMDMILPDRSIEEKEVGELKYQLFTATAGTLLEAVNKDKKECIFLVLAFHSADEPVNEANKKSFNDFKRIVCGENKDSKEFIVNDKRVNCWFVEREITFVPGHFMID